MKQLLLTTIAAVLLVGCGGPPKDIWEAAEQGDIEAVKEYLAIGTNVNAKGEDGWTPLNLTHDPETIDLLRKHGGKTKNELEAEAKK